MLADMAKFSESAAREKAASGAALVGYFLSGGVCCLSPDSGASVGSSFSIAVMNSPIVTHTIFSIDRNRQSASKVTV